MSVQKNTPQIQGYSNNKLVFFSPKSKNEQGLYTIISGLKKFEVGQAKKSHFFDYLKKNGIKGKVTKESSDFVQYESPSATQGTRFFRVFATKKNNNLIFSNVSFEYKKGNGSYERVLKALKANLTIQRIKKNKYYQQWETQNSLITIKMLKEKDLKNHPTRNYKPEDIGTTLITQQFK